MTPSDLQALIHARAGLFSRVVGRPVHAGVDYSAANQHMDHVHLVVALEPEVEIRASLNTLSRWNRDAGFDPRIRVGILRSTHEELPETGIFDGGTLDYVTLGKQANIFFEYYDRKEMESLLIEKAGRAVLAEIWGDIYARHHFGIHQIHSRRASCAVAEDVAGRDGALKFYYGGDNTGELLLFKFCGQP